ncbi:MAG: ankyrin repeat domain-containing protein [bacterium]
MKHNCLYQPFFILMFITNIIFSESSKIIASPFSEKNDQVEAQLIRFYNNHISSYGYQSEIEIPVDLNKNYIVRFKTNNDNNYFFIVKSDELLLKKLELSDEVLSKKNTEEIFRFYFNSDNSSFIKLKNSRHGYSESGEVFLHYINGSFKKINFYNQLLENEFYFNVFQDINNIESFLHNVASIQKRNDYEIVLNELVLRAFHINQYRQRMWNSYNVDLAENLDRAINNALPGTKSKAKKETSIELKQMVEDVILSNININIFEDYLEDIIRKRVIKKTKYGIDNYVRNIVFQVDYQKNEIIRWRNKLGKYGGTKHKVYALNNYLTLKSRIPSKYLSYSSKYPYEFPEDIKLLRSLSFLPESIRVDTTETTENEQKYTGNKIIVSNIENSQRDSSTRTAIYPLDVDTINNIPEDDKVIALIDPEKLDLEKEETEIIEIGSLTEEELEDNDIVPSSTLNEPKNEINAVDVITKGKPSEIEDIITEKVDLNVKNSFGGNIYHKLVHKISDPETILLLSKNYNINQSDDFGNTPLHYAILMGDYDIAASLIDAGADLSKINLQGYAPVHLSTIMNNPELTDLIIAKGADINSLSKENYSSMHISTQLGHATIAKGLLLNNAEHKVKTSQGLKPKNIAKIQSNSTIKKLLKKDGKYHAHSNLGPEETRNILLKNELLVLDKENNYPQLSLQFSYDDHLLKSWKRWRTIKWISIPTFILSASTSAYLYSRANNYYNQYTEAVTNEDARYYYDLTGEYDIYTYISTGVSAISLYFTIHSTIAIPRLERKLKKSYY